MIPQRRPTRIPVPIASALASLYARAIAHKNQQFDQGSGVTTFEQRVISIGNLSAGGTGKTPLVQWVVRELIAHNHTPCIAMRGYRSTPTQRSDEELEHADAFPDVPVVAQKARAQGLKELFHVEHSIDAIVLDDGFQHRQIARDVDIVVIDASRPPSEDALLPLGFLRERMGSLGRADAVVITHAERVEDDSLERTVRGVAEHLRDGVPIAVTEHVWDALWVERLGSDRGRVEPGSIGGERVFALCAIGNPDAFLGTLGFLGAEVVDQEIRGDHDAYPGPLLDRVAARVSDQSIGTIVTTRKDWSKLGDRLLSRLGERVRVCVPELSLGFRSGEDALRDMCLGLSTK